MANINNVTCFALIINAAVQQIKDLEENLCQQEEKVMPKKEVRGKLKKAVLCWTTKSGWDEEEVYCKMMTTYLTFSSHLCHNLILALLESNHHHPLSLVMYCNVGDKVSNKW